ncbi:MULTISPECIES: Lrp/AsnC family transcriptional regulator [unclassified Roseitalea]|uniref:Lrp/AsnC family transcriptional regulator n=1 Tax=unclassified Roseitalea TaxID=2639107 RepID=UPI00273FA77C|nr:MULTISPECIES: Lrp/AsnC family transcriptional regulator [unclassified Roseitalea]
MSNAELSQRVGMSCSPCWRRVKRLEEDEIILGYRASLSPSALGLIAFVSVKIGAHSDDEAEAFGRALQDVPEIVACYSITGAADFLLQIVTADLESYAMLSAKVLRRLPGIKEMNSSLMLNEVKAFKGFPIQAGGVSRSQR